jgi:hypothetical protein
MSFSTRRTFLQTALAAAASLFLPRFLLTRGNSFWFLHTSTGECWAVDDPVAWSLDNALQPILERARERLVTLNAADPQRVIRVVVRRCRLNLLELRPGRVTVHHWGQQGQGDLRPLFKQHGLATKGVRVALLDRKREVSTPRHGDDFLFGERLPPFWPWKAYQTKWQRRAVQEPDDWTAAPHTWSGFAWEGIEPNRIPWAALKSAWRRATRLICQNCDEPTILVNFGFAWCGMFNRRTLFIYGCGKCRRLFEDRSVKDVPIWIVMNLDAEVWPDYDMVWDRTREREPPGDRQGGSETWRGSHRCTSHRTDPLQPPLQDCYKKSLQELSS